jgi:hypothetical protein
MARGSPALLFVFCGGKRKRKGVAHQKRQHAVFKHKSTKRSKEVIMSVSAEGGPFLTNESGDVFEGNSVLKPLYVLAKIYKTTAVALSHSERNFLTTVLERRESTQKRRNTKFLATQKRTNFLFVRRTKKKEQDLIRPVAVYPNSVVTLH